MAPTSLAQRFLAFFFSKLGRASVLGFWLLVAGLLVSAFPAASHEEKNQAQALPASANSAVASAKVQAWFPDRAGVPAFLVWYDPSGLTARDWQVILSTVRDLRTHPVTAEKSVPPLDLLPLSSDRAFASPDGQALAVPILLARSATQDQIAAAVRGIEQAVQRAAGAQVLNASEAARGLHAYITGPAGISVDATKLFKHADFALLGATTVLVLGLMIVLYRSPVLALIPLAGVGVAYAVTSALLGEAARAYGLAFDAQTLSILTVLLFGAGTDYCLFLIARYRAELRRHEQPVDAMRAAYPGATGAILMSGATVALSLLALLAARYPSFHEFAIPFALGVIVMALVAASLIPALLLVLGRAAFWPVIPRFAPDDARAGEPGRISRWLGRSVVRRPLAVALSGAVALATFALVAPHARTTYDLLSSFPADMPSREGYQVLTRHFSPGAIAPVDLVIQGGDAEKARAALARMADVKQATELEENRAVDASLVQVLLNVDPYSQAAVNAIPALEREAANAAHIAGQAPVRVLAAGETASEADTQAITARDTRVVIPIVLAAIGLLLFAYLRSIVAACYLLATIVLSYGAALGIGWLVIRGLLGEPAMQGAIPLYAFVFLVALGEDYNIFVMSRIWERWRHEPLTSATAGGVADTASVITSAGLILAGTFAVLASLPIQVLLQFGIVTAIGVLLDTFVVRPWVVPAITVLLGDAAGWPGGRWRRATRNG
ncbi:MMPL family transporter [Alicyclobacillus vulcanalis]|uniref:MMPL family transporter n=1 Tax=Alicyclobacillus vulcanalis TaxID=252246 RepID=UPI001177BF86|nr:MMPL family transporter [Alicyclobacillus vulcanalis]